jgi:hypothetical protein
VYEVFVEEVIDGPEPTLYADLLCTVDGLKAFHARRMGLRSSPTGRSRAARASLRPGPPPEASVSPQLARRGPCR